MCGFGAQASSERARSQEHATGVILGGQLDKRATGQEGNWPRGQLRGIT